MIENFGAATRAALIDHKLAPADHPVWSERPYKVFLKMLDEVRTRIDYVKRNPQKEGLAEQNWEFMVPLDS